jgi:hypothetical protein
MRPVRGQIDDTGKVILWLPHNRRDPLGLHDGDEHRDQILDELDRKHWEKHREWTEALRQWVKEEKMCEDCAILARSQWKDDGDAEWERMRLVKLPMQYIAPPMQYEAEPVEPAPKPYPPQSNGKDDVPPPWKEIVAKAGAVTVLFCEPFRGFQVGSGRRYEADERGEVIVDEADPDDRADLIKMGCREWR